MAHHQLRLAQNLLILLLLLNISLSFAHYYYEPGDESIRVRRSALGGGEEDSKSSLSKDKTIKKSTILSKSPLISTTANNDTSPTNSSTKSTTMKSSIVVDVVPIKEPSNKNSSTTESSRNSELYPPFPEFPPDLSKNYTLTNETAHKYYNSSYYHNGEFLWVDLEGVANSQKHELLSDAHRRAATVPLGFNFPFYGHLVANVTMATGGFIYLGEHVHAWLAATQYVAPLMANFDSRVNTAFVRYLSNSSQFTVEWKEVFLHDGTDKSPFTFQATLYKNGTIVFAYKLIPINIKELNDTNHPVKIGLSDAYITDKTLLFVKSRTIFEYDRVDLKEYEIKNGSAIVFTPLPTCLSYDNCHECTQNSLEAQFKCVWCPKVERCSDGTDRHRQEWLVANCASSSFSTPVSCFIGTTSSPLPPHDNNSIHFSNSSSRGRSSSSSESDVRKNFINEEEEHYPYTPMKIKHETVTGGGGMSGSGILGLFMFLTIIFVCCGWIFYAYRNPHTPSGQLLIRFRPSQWSAFRRGEARYTAASIHM